ncbi:MAG: hypothetical protein ACKVJF_08145, partial [Flavobacteriales bacterium]
MEHTCHSEYHEMDLVLINSVPNAFVDEAKLENEWAVLNYLSKPDYSIAVKEFGSFERLLQSKGASILRLPQDSTASIDVIYARDAAIMTNFGVILCRMGKERRMPEPKLQEHTYKKNKVPILGQIVVPGTVE